MVENNLAISLNGIDSKHKAQESGARSHRAPDNTSQFGHNQRCSSHERITFEHNHFTHGKIIKASHDIPHEPDSHHEHKHHEDHARTVTIKKRIVSENILFDSFPPNS